MSHFCRVVCNAMGWSESVVCIAFVLGIIVTTPDVHVSGMVPALRKRLSDSCICGSKTSENLLKNFAEKPSSPGALLLFNLLRPSCTMSGQSCLNSSRPALRSHCSTPNALRYATQSSSVAPVGVDTRSQCSTSSWATVFAPRTTVPALDTRCWSFFLSCSSLISRYNSFLRILKSPDVSPDAITPLSLESVSMPVLPRCAFSYTPTRRV